MIRLWTQEELTHIADDNTGSSIARRALAFQEIVTRPDFPCTFTWLPFATNSIRYGLIPPSESGYEYLVLESLKKLAVLSTTDVDTTLVIFMPGDQAEVVQFDDDDRPASASLAVDFEVARLIVRTVMGDNQTSESDATQPHWSLQVDGTDIFMNFSSPRHHLRRSRNVGDCLTLIAQPRASFDIKGRSRPSVREHIRSRVRQYDQVPPHPALGTHGQVGNREAHQYFLGDGLTSLDPTV